MWKHLIPGDEVFSTPKLKSSTSGDEDFPHWVVESLNIQVKKLYHL